MLSFSFLYFKGLAIKVQEQKRDEAVSRLIPAAASVIANWWRLRCAQRGHDFIATWRIYSLVQRRVIKYSVPEFPQTNSTSSTIQHSVSHSEERNSSRRSRTRRTVKPKIDVRKKPINSIDDLPKRYITAIKIIRVIKYASACKKFHHAKHPMNINEVVHENNQMTNRVSIMLNDIQRRLDLALGTKKVAQYLPDDQKRQLSLSARIEYVEKLTNQFESKLNYLEQLATNLIEHN